MLFNFFKKQKSRASLKKKYATQQQLLAGLANYEDDVCVLLNLEVLPSCYKHAAKFKIDHDVASGEFVDALTDLCILARNGELVAFDSESGIQGYLFNRFKNKIKLIVDKDKRHAGKEDDVSDVLKNPQENVEKTLEKREKNAVLWKAVDELGEPYKTLLIDYYKKGLSYEEILANPNNTSPSYGALKKQKSDCIKKLQKKISKNKDFFTLD